MVTRSADQATDCTARFTDWTTIGSRILEAALIASAIHARESHPASSNPTTPGWRASDRDLVFDWPEAGRARE